MLRKVITGAFVLVMACTASAASDRWLHVKVDENGGSNEQVRVNVPLALAERVLPLIQARNLGDGKVSINNGRVRISPGAMKIDTGGEVNVNLREMWQAVKDTGDARFVSVDSDHETVRVERKGGFLLIDVVDQGTEDEAGDRAATAPGAKGRSETVTVRIPVEVVDALFSGAEDELNILAAIRVLGEQKGIDLVTVDDGESKVRIWVDDLNTSE
jgi:hypothetical protein